jgi:hypothetical protein
MGNGKGRTATMSSNRWHAAVDQGPDGELKALATRKASQTGEESHELQTKRRGQNPRSLRQDEEACHMIRQD